MFKHFKFKILLISKDLKYFANLKNFDDFYPNELNRNQIYKYFLFYFYKYLPCDLIKHRLFFSKNKRGFGEDPFHSMWYFIFKKFRPTNILEIGVYRGQTLSLFTILSNSNSIESNIYGLSPLDNTGDSVSEYLQLNYKKDIEYNFKYFGLDYPNIIEAVSESDIGSKLISSQKWDLVYIDGSHEYKDVKFDVTRVLDSLNIDGLLVLDDSSLYTDFNNISFEKYNLKTFKGHEGPSRIFKELLEDKSLKFLIGVGHNNVFKKINTSC